MPLRHLYIDSRFRTSGTESNFTVNLQENINLPLGARCFIAGVSFSNAFYTLERDVNNRLFMAIQHNGVTGGYTFPLLEGNYGGEALAVEISKWLLVIDIGCQVSHVKNLGKIRIIMSPDFSIKLISDEELVDPTKHSGDHSHPQSRTIKTTRGASTRC